ncbi:acyl-CoA dehydrogenase family protein [Rummeliibacillus suwonensis]|uniref:acyl-CoA dehydrogenase family protein n=1 Tax=Rummeliibacillus suwonensis TaxID=1306154 RepID=UPI001AAFA257|nr:acyl-CoA dehydrogenase family protein [Rummeliibacillus suwonensis]MBO2535210.1 acyl-CoA dehydrogenase family protein [Rummeliibacillus suwonensis]
MAIATEKNIYDRQYLQKLREEITAFVDANVKPNVKIDDVDGFFPRESINALGKAGWNSILFDESLKGLDLGYTGFVIVTEEIAKADASTGLVYAMHIAASEKIYIYGTEDQKKRWLLPVRDEGKITTFAISEKATGGHVWYNLSRAIQDGDEYILNFEKSFTTSGGEADFYVAQTGTANTTEPSAQSYFIVAGQQEGIIAKPWKALGVRGNQSGPLVFENIRVHKRDLLDATPEDIYQNSAAIIGLNAVWLGVAQAALDAAIDHVKKTENKGFHNSLADHQILRVKLAEVVIRIKSSRAWLLDIARHLDELKEAGKPLTEATHEINELKVQVTELADFAARTAMDVAGGYGYHVSIFEKLYRDARGGIPMAPSNNIALDQIGKGLVGLPIELWEKGK